MPVELKRYENNINIYDNDKPSLFKIEFTFNYDTGRTNFSFQLLLLADAGNF